MIVFLFGLFIGWNSQQTLNFEKCKANDFKSEHCEYSKKLNQLGNK